MLSAVTWVTHCVTCSLIQHYISIWATSYCVTFVCLIYIVKELSSSGPLLVIILYAKSNELKEFSVKNQTEISKLRKEQCTQIPKIVWCQVVFNPEYPCKFLINDKKTRKVSKFLWQAEWKTVLNFRNWRWVELFFNGCT